MIEMKDIRAALVNLLKNKAGLGYEVHFDNVKEASKSYVYITITSKRTTRDRVYYDRVLTVDIQLRLLPDKFIRTHRNELYDAADKLDKTIRPVIQIFDRFITVQEVRNRIVDDILHYEFELDFTDYLPEEQLPFMENLEANMKVNKFGEFKIKEDTADGE